MSDKSYLLSDLFALTARDPLCKRTLNIQTEGRKKASAVLCSLQLRPLSRNHFLYPFILLPAPLSDLSTAGREVWQDKVSCAGT